ncbi:MAG: hypothetical protein WEE50_02430 [Chloroflexota bacterium]
MSDWRQPASPGPDGSPPRTYWAEPTEVDALGPGQLIRRAFRLYRAAPRRFLLVAAGPELIRDLLGIPSLAITLGVLEGFVSVFRDYLAAATADPDAYRADPAALQAAFEAQLRTVLVPQPDLAALSAATGAAGVTVGLIGTAALTAVALAAVAGRPVSLGGVFRAVAARGGLIKPIVAIGVGWMAVSWVPLLLQTSPEFQTWAGAPGSPRSVLLASLLSVLAVVVFVFVIVLAVRWALYIPAVIAESLGVGRGLGRAAQLSRGIRSRLGLAMAGILLMHALSVGVVAAVVGIAVGISAESLEVGLAAYLGASLLGNLLWAPVLPAMLALAYHTRVGQAASTASERG